MLHFRVWRDLYHLEIADPSVLQWRGGVLLCLGGMDFTRPGTTWLTECSTVLRPESGLCGVRSYWRKFSSASGNWILLKTMGRWRNGAWFTKAELTLTKITFPCQQNDAILFVPHCTYSMHLQGLTYPCFMWFIPK